MPAIESPLISTAISFQIGQICSKKYLTNLAQRDCELLKSRLWIKLRTAVAIAPRIKSPANKKTSSSVTVLSLLPPPPPPSFAGLADFADFPGFFSSAMLDIFYYTIPLKILYPRQTNYLLVLAQR